VSDAAQATRCRLRYLMRRRLQAVLLRGSAPNSQLPISRAHPATICAGGFFNGQVTALACFAGRVTWRGHMSESTGAEGGGDDEHGGAGKLAPLKLFCHPEATRYSLCLFVFRVPTSPRLPRWMFDVVQCRVLECVIRSR
jgi:hypothetical protein